MKIKIIADSACDLPLSYVKENEIEIVPLTVNIKGTFYKDDLGVSITYDDFYKAIRAGELTSTAQVNIYSFEETFKKYVEEGYAIIYIGLASVLSGTYNSARVARDNILEKYPEANINVIDSTVVTMGIGILINNAKNMANKGKSPEEIVTWVEENKSRVNHAIVLDNLAHLKRGGRISGATAAVGTLLGVKPTLYINRDGSLSQGPKVKGRKKAISYLLNELREKGENLENQVIYIAHADSKEDALGLKNKILEEFKVKDIIVNDIGTVIGTHAGPDALAILFLGKERS